MIDKKREEIQNLAVEQWINNSRNWNNRVTYWIG